MLNAETMKVVLVFLLKKHMNTFHDQRKKQRNRGAVRLVLTDVIAKIYMTWWDRRFKEEAEKR